MKARQDKVFNLNCSKVDRRLESKIDRPDFLSYITKPKDGVTMPIQELYANSTLLVLAGSESTASGLAGITFQLLKNPEALKKAVAEIRATFEREADIEPDSVKRLSYLAAVVSEGLRMYPPFPEGLPRLTPRQGALICGQWVPGGVSDCKCRKLLLVGLLTNTSHSRRRTYKLAHTSRTAALLTSQTPTPSLLSVGWAISGLQLTLKKHLSHSLSVRVAALVGSE